MSNFPTSLDTFVDKVDAVDDYMAADINVCYDAIEKLEVKVGIDSSMVTTSLDYKVNNFFITGRALWLYEDTAPTGWTVVAAAADALLAVKGGTQAYNTNGGTQVGTWTHPNHQHTTGDCTLTISQIPAHTHSLYLSNSGGDGAQAWRAYADNYTSTTTQSQGGGAAHNHGSTGDSATVNTWRPLAQVGIIVSKD